MGKDIERQEITLPHDSDAERNVLSGMLLEPDQLPALGLTPSDFFDAWHRDIFKAMDELVQLAHAGDGTNIIVVQHTNKNDEDKRPGGSIAFTASADVILHLSVEGPDRRRVLSGVKNRFDERYLLEPTVIGLNQTTGHIEAKGTKAEAVYKDVSADMLTALSNGPMMQVDLLDAVTAKTGGKSKTVIRLEEVGKIERKREGKGYLCSLKETSSAPSLRFPRGGEALNMPALPLPPPYRRGGRGRANVEEEKPMNEETRADEILHDPIVWAAIDEYWRDEAADSDTFPLPEPEPDSPAHAAMLLCDVLTQRAHTPEQQAIVNEYRAEPYDSKRNAVAVLHFWESLLAVVQTPEHEQQVRSINHES